MIHNLSSHKSILNKFLYEMRSVEKQKDSMRFRTNMERMGEIMAYEISKHLNYSMTTVETPLGEANIELPNDSIVMASILRAGLPLHQGFCAFLMMWKMVSYQPIDHTIKMALLTLNWSTLLAPISTVKS